MSAKLSLNNFKFVVGETIAFCQMVEHDLKVIFATIASGDFNENFEFFKTWTLGQTVNEIEAFDEELETPNFTRKEYAILKSMTKKRNYICHEIFRTFAYIKNFGESKEFELACDVLLDFHEDVVEIAKSIERVRIRSCANLYSR